MPRKRSPTRQADLERFAERLALAAQLRGVSVESLSQILFRDARLPGRLRRQADRIAARRLMLENFIKSYSKAAGNSAGSDSHG